MPKWLILVDLDDTLMPTNYRYHEASWRCGLIIQKALAGRSKRPMEVLELQREIDRGLFKEMGFLVSRFPRSWVLTYEQMCASAGVPVSAKVRQRIQNTAAYFKYGPFRPFVGIKTALRRLRRQKHRLHLITAGEVVLQRRKIEQAGLVKYFDDGNFTVCPMHKKDDMQRLAAEFNGPVMMVGDSKRNDIRPAKELGLTTIWIPSETKHDSDGKVEPDYEIRSFTLLPDLMSKIKPPK